MAPDSQDRIKAIAEEHGADNVIVVLGAVDLELLKVAAETVTTGDPTYVGALAGVQLDLPVVHILERDVKSQVDPALYQEQVGLVEMTADIDNIAQVMSELRREAS
jgi:betaine reductase